MNKKERLERIKNFIKENVVGTQEAIVEYLKKSGFSATQATVSRDIKELGIVKIPLKDNTYIYELPKSVVGAMSLTQNNVLTVKAMSNMINLDLVPGTTAFVKKRIIDNFGEEIFSAIYDDDSILLVIYDENRSQSLIDRIKNL